MFEFAIAQHRTRPPSRRFLASVVASCLAHVLAVVVLLEFPELLRPGISLWLRKPLLVFVNTPPKKTWRTVTVLGSRMQMPSSETLRRNTYDWNAHGRMTEPPIQIRWGKEAAPPPESAKGPVPKPVMGTNEPKPVPEVAQAEPVAGTPPSADAGLPTGETDGTAMAQGGSGTTGRVYLPPPASEPRQIPKKTETATAPSSIPNSVKPATPPAETADASSAQVKVFDDEKKAIRSEGTGFFDTKGFPLGEYASAIIERVKGNWSIPSNLRSSQGRTTVIFYIGKDGRFTDARIATSSGSYSLDIAALNAVLVSNPFPPLPNGFPGSQVGAKFVFSYNESH